MGTRAKWQRQVFIPEVRDDTNIARTRQQANRFIRARLLEGRRVRVAKKDGLVLVMWAAGYPRHQVRK